MLKIEHFQFCSIKNTLNIVKLQFFSYNQNNSIWANINKTQKKMLINAVPTEPISFIDDKQNSTFGILIFQQQQICLKYIRYSYIKKNTTWANINKSQKKLIINALQTKTISDVADKQNSTFGVLVSETSI